MHLILPSIAVAASVVAATSSTKRGLCYVPNGKYPADNDVWDSSNSDLTWYYNYQAFPSSTLNAKLAFVPMLWGPPSSPATDMSFYNTVKNLIASGVNVTFVLGFNEPDAATGGGSNMLPTDAATVWKKQMEPLKRDFGIKLGAPAVTGAPSGQVWMQEFMAGCSAISNSSCAVDFFPVHWYGNFAGLSSHIEEVNASYPNVSSIWVTEFACANCTLYESQDFYNSSITWLDNLSYVTHYSYFGAFRSSESNIGANAAFLNANGKLTEMGGWYLNEATTGTTSSAASGRVAYAGWGVVLAASAFSALLL